jgi:glycosyltransferase involved in cell wall biosynthesis
MHFLHVIHRYHPFKGGSEGYIQDLSERLVAEGHQVTVLTTDAWDLEHFRHPGRRSIAEREAIHHGVRIVRFPVRRVPGAARSYNLLRRLTMQLGRLPGAHPLQSHLARLTPHIPELARYLARSSDRFDLVHTTNIGFESLIIPAARYCERRGIPHVCTPFVHLGEPENQHTLRHYTQPHQLDLLRRATRVVVQTGLEGRALRERGVSDARLRTVGCWVFPEDLAGGDCERFRQAYTIAGPIVLSIGAAAYGKGTVHTVEAMRRLWADGCDATLVLVASGTLADFEEFFATLPEPIKQRIRLIKAAPHQDKLDALAAADVFVLPSRTDSFGIVYLEAWAYRLPVVGAFAGGVPDVIEDGHDGLLVKFGDISALARRIQQLLSDPLLASTLGENGHAKMLRSHTFAEKYAALKQVYEEALQGDDHTDGKPSLTPRRV